MQLKQYRPGRAAETAAGGRPASSNAAIRCRFSPTCCSSSATAGCSSRPPISKCRSPRTPSSPGKEPQAVTVAARKLQDLLRALPDDATLNVDVLGKPDDRARRALALQPADAAGGGLSAHRHRPRTQLQTLTLPQRDLRGAAASSVEFAMAQQDIRYYLNGMLLVVDQAIAAGGRDRRASAVVGEPRDRRRLSRGRK